MDVIRQGIFISSQALNRGGNEAEDSEVIAISFAYALEDIPTAHLYRSFEWAIREKTDTYPLTAMEVIRAHKDMLPHLSDEARMLDQGPMLPLGIDEMNVYMTAAAWKAKHSLPEDWTPTEGYPPWSDLYARTPPEPNHGKPANYGKIDRSNYPMWYQPTKAPWEIYPDKEHPKRSIVTIPRQVTGPTGFNEKIYEKVEYAHWVERCVEIDFPGVSCNGSVTEHYGPDGAWERQLPCPMHSAREGG